jgi:DNA-directed RNA polymerase subunit RPC12/RpoP
MSLAPQKFPDFKKYPKKEWEKEYDGRTYECTTCGEEADHYTQHPHIVEEDAEGELYPQMRCPHCFSYWFYEKEGVCRVN